MTKRKMKLNKIYNILDMPHLLLVDSPVSGPVSGMVRLVWSGSFQNRLYSKGSSAVIVHATE